MLKSLHKNDTQLTPFVATKDWELTNVENEDLLLMEHSGSDGGPIALEYINYGSSSITFNYACAIAKENQEKDRAVFRIGLLVDGIFYPDSDPQNLDGTYQRMVYAQIKGTFYNNYRDPTKMWGMEQIDFDKSQTKKFLSDQFELYEIPQAVFGEKMLPNTIVMYNTNLDNDYIIVDDGHNNLFAGPNIFSHQQELGEYGNVFFSGSDQYCDAYLGLQDPTRSVVATDSMTVGLTYYAGAMGPEEITTETQSYIIGFFSGSTENFPTTESNNSIGIGFYQGSLNEHLEGDTGSITSIGFVFGSIFAGAPVTESPQTVTFGVYSGSTVSTIFGVSGSSETASIFDIGFESGSIFNTVIALSRSAETASIFDIGFESGSIFETTIPLTGSSETASLFDIGFESGSIATFIVTSSRIEYVYEVRLGFVSGTLS